MVKVLLQLYPVLRAEDEDERRRLRPHGRNVAAYQEAMTTTLDVVRAADRLGLWGVATHRAPLPLRGLRGGPQPGRC